MHVARLRVERFVVSDAGLYDAQPTDAVTSDALLKDAGSKFVRRLDVADMDGVFPQWLCVRGNAQVGFRLASEADDRYVSATLCLVRTKTVAAPATPYSPCAPRRRPDSWWRSPRSARKATRR